MDNGTWEDLMLYGTAFEKDGKRIDPKDVFKTPESLVVDAAIKRYRALQECNLNLNSGSGQRLIDAENEENNLVKDLLGE